MYFFPPRGLCRWRIYDRNWEYSASVILVTCWLRAMLMYWTQDIYRHHFAEDGDGQVDGDKYVVIQIAFHLESQEMVIGRCRGHGNSPWKSCH